MRNITLLVIALCSVLSLSVEAQRRIEKQITFEQQAQRNTISSEALYAYSFDKEKSHVVLPIKHISVVSNGNHTVSEIELELIGHNQQGQVVYPFIIDQGMEVISQDKGQFYLPLNHVANSSIVFNEPIISFEARIDRKIYDSAVITFDAFTTVEQEVNTRSSVDICHFSHVAVVIDDSKSNSEDVEQMIRMIDASVEGLSDFEKISIVSLNASGRFFTSESNDKAIQKHLNSFRGYPESKYTDWSNGFSNLQMIHQKDPIDYVIVIADGFTNFRAKKSISFSESLTQINQEIQGLSSIDKLELQLINPFDSPALHTFLKEVLAFDAVKIVPSSQELDLDFQSLKKDCAYQEIVNNIKISPNPTSDYVTILGLEALESENLTIQIRDVQSRMIQKHIVEEHSSPIISLQTYTDGLYFLEIIYQGKVIKVQKIVKIK